MRSLVAAGIVVFYSSFGVFAQTVSQVQSVSLNSGNTVCASALMSDSSKRNYCWGRNVGRIFLNNSAHSSPTPVIIDAPTNVISIFPGGSSAIGLSSDGPSFSWGNNSEGELGQGNIGGAAYLPHNLSSVKNILWTLSVGSKTTCAREWGSVWCWGKNDRGQLGAGFKGSTTYAPYLGWDNQNISTKNQHTCAVKNDGKVYCAGSNDSWQLGNSGGEVFSLSSFLPETTYSQVSVGYFHTCAIYAGGKVKCWGENWNGQLGHGLKSEKELPADVVNLSNATYVGTGRNFSCVITTNGRVGCWGSNSNGQLGTSLVSESLTLRIIPGLLNVTSLQVGDKEACAISGGQLYCWGRNSYGQLATGDYVDRFQPTLVNFALTSAPRQIGIISGTNSTCSLSNVSQPRCWGANDKGQLGTSWRSPFVDQPTVADVLPQNVTKLSLANGHSCFITSSFQLFCWGTNFSGELGNGGFADAIYPTEVTSLSGTPIDVSVGTDNTCAILSDGTLQCWGANWHGQLGIGTGTGVFSFPQIVPFANPIVSVSASRLGEQTCAADSLGKVYCWGSNYDYEVGQDNDVLFNPSPLEVPGLSGITKVATGEVFSCALNSSGKVFCWGSNWAGQTGGGDYVGVKLARAVRNLTGIVDVQLGGTHACALSSKKKLFCWGAGNYGQLGNGQWDNIPTPMEILSDVASFSVGRWHTCAVDTDDNVSCWGRADQGQLGVPEVNWNNNLPVILELKK